MGKKHEFKRIGMDEIEAIKEYRVATGESLKESKEKIDEFYEKLKATNEI